MKASGLSYAIIRPALIYAPEELLLNNVAWLLRHMPFFLMPGTGDYPIQPDGFSTAHGGVSTLRDNRPDHELQ